MTEPQKMKSIWFFVGLTLLAMGMLVFGSGVFMLFSPPAKRTVLFHLRPNLWWGGIMMVAGLLFLLSRGQGKNG